ncbi:VOC family protein [Marmoricola endophyticus]|uniref:VOC family protein n=1 Tax=Marmoricola endophyticus TaxID=2040280 RepID=A0A917F227_9ACTN|nr:VOC family protein [Marmoricola endophyticus]GGF37155.1 VOC family protein [Marmoricola endophyticus]
MTAILTPYLNFAGNAREAMEFYQSVIGGDLQVMTFADMGGMGLPEDEQAQVMHAALTAGDGLVVFASDVPHGMYETPQGFGVALSGTDLERLRGWWDGLSAGATIQMPLEKAPWGDWFGSLDDRFGINWLVNITGS